MTFKELSNKINIKDVRELNHLNDEQQEKKENVIRNLKR